MRTSPGRVEAWRLAERRKEARFTLILRVGVLEQAGRPALCLVKNISSMGAQVKVYSKFVPDAGVILRVADEPPVRGRLIWLRDDIAGISFEQELDTPTLLRVQQKLRSKRRRTMPRVAIRADATVRTGGRVCRASLLDISSLGVRIRTRSALMPGDRAILELPVLGSIRAYVRWCDGEESGLTFETAIPMQQIAAWIASKAATAA